MAFLYPEQHRDGAGFQQLQGVWWRSAAAVLKGSAWGMAAAEQGHANPLH